MHDHIRQKVKELADGNVPKHGSIRVVCPACGHYNKTMSLQDTPSGVRYKCFRASCGVWGNVNDHYVRAPEQFIPKPITKLSISPLPEHYIDKLPVIPINIPRFDPVTKAVLYPVLSNTGVRRGWVGRKYDWIEKFYGAKSRDYIELDSQPFCHYPKKVEGSCLVLVEDIPSAERLAAHVPACALCGTDVSLEFVDEWLALGITHLIVALDPDATHKAAAIKTKWAGLFNITIINLDDDVKDLPEDNFVQLTENLIGRIQAN